MKSILTKFFLTLFCGLIAVSSLYPNFTYASSVCDIDCKGDTTCLNIQEANGCDGSSSGSIDSTITNILNVVIGISGLIAVIFIVVGGVSYMTSAGDVGKIKKAKDTILYACIGLVICALSFAIVNFVIVKVIS